MNEFSLSCLCKLSSGKNAWQSSEYGRYSAANVLNDDGVRDFGFHTQEEENPWWEIDLKDVYKLSHIKLANRRRVCQERAGTLTVEISESGEDSDWQTVHTGIMHWDGDVTFFLAGRVKARWVRLSLREKNMFHLANVEIWGCALSARQLTPPAPERFCLYDAPGLEGMDEISKGASVTQNGNTLTFDFKDIYPIEAVVLEKPLSAGWDGAESLRMEVSRDGQSWQLIHKGLMYWVAKMYYPLRGEVIGRFLRLSPGTAPAEKKGFIRSLFASAKALGLHKARVFTKMADLTVHCAKPDGFGARLLSLLYAVYLSKILNIRMTFVWPELTELSDYKPGDIDRHLLDMQLSPPDKIFSEDFMQKYLLPGGPVSYSALMAGNTNMFRRHFLNPRYHDMEKMMFSIYRPHPSNDILSGSLKAAPGFDYSDAFRLIGFSPEMSAMIEAAQKVNIPPDYTAVHMRSGELIYSDECRYSGDRIPQTRAVPISLTRMVLEKLEKEACPAVLLFGEDVSAMRILAADFKNVRLAFDLAPSESLSVPERCLFDIVLLSRARLIYAPTISAFSNLPELIAEKKPERRFIHDLFALQEMVAGIEQDLCENVHRYPPLHSAYSYKLLYWTDLDRNCEDKLLHFAEKAAECDPENPVYVFFKALEYCRRGEFRESEEILSAFCKQRPEEKQWHRALPEDRYLHPLQKSAELGNPFACRLMSVAAARRKDQPAAERWRHLALSGGVRNLAPAGQARQSSEYAWGGGRTDAANALNDDGQRDLGFHTKEEDNPWWEVELEEVCALDRIVLVNRRRVCQERIQTLTVEVSPEKPGEEWVTIHTGLISWDGSLVLPLGGRIKARRVRLSLREKRMFHLASVEVWGAPLSVRPEGSIEPERFYLYDQEAENGCEVLLKGSLELGPGLVVAELTAAAPLEALLISKAGEENWPDLKIESSRDGQKWLTIHEGQLYWAGQMHYPLQGEVFARFVRLSSKTEAEKGEKAAPINVKILNTKEKQGLCVIHRKHAGLGDRMCSFVNAMYLADVLALPMRMVWPVMDRPNFECEGTDVLDPGVDGAENVFDENFRSAHLRPDLPLTYASKLLAKQNLNRRNLIAPTMMDEPGLLHSSKLNIKTLLSRGLAPSETWELRHYFKQIGFAPELRAVIEAAEKIDLEAGMTAIHFRAGDLVYRSDRSITFEDILFGFQTKGLPLQLARMSIEHALKSGYKNIIIFSENVTVSQTLADDYNIRYARQFWPAGKLSTPQISFFEAVLMSRASVIYRPDSSAFSNFAQTISEGAKMVNAHEFFTYEDILPYFQADLKKNGTRYPAPQNANSYGYLYYISKSRQKTDFLLEILEAAALAAPGNVTFKVFKALELFQAGRDGEGEAALKEVFAFNHKAKNFDLIDTSSRALRDKNFVNWRNAELKPVFESAAQRGNPFACYMTSLIYSCQGKQAEATSWHEAALRNIA